jgi:hypothetical protein
MEAALELIRQGLVHGEGEDVARIIDERSTLPQLIVALMNIFDTARLEANDRKFRQLAMDASSAALDRAGFEFSYINDGRANLQALRDRLARTCGVATKPSDPRRRQ